jgi:hypothetical protein
MNTATPPRSPFWTAEDVAARYGRSRDWVWALARSDRIPHRVLAGTGEGGAGRGYLFIPADLERWEAGASLEVIEPKEGGKVVRPT